MNPLLPSTAAVTLLPAAILPLLIAAFLALRILRGSRLPANLLLLGAMTCLAAFALLSFGEHSLLQEHSLACIYLQSPLLSLATVFLIQFTYHFPSRWEARRLESRLALATSSTAAAWEAAFAWNRLQSLWNDGLVFWRSPWMDAVQTAGFAWGALVLLRQAQRFRREARQAAHAGFAHALSPAHRRSRAALTTALVLALAATLAWLVEFQPLGLPATWRPFLLSEGMLLLLLLFALIYLNQQPEITSILVKLLGLSLAAILLALNLAVGITTRVYQSVYTSRPPGFQPWLPPSVQTPQTLRFLPQPNGGYLLKRLTLRWINPTAPPHPPSAFTTGALPVSLEFPFRFFDREWTRLHLGQQGYIAFGRDPSPDGFRAYYGLTPAIVAYLAHFAPVASTNGIGIVIQSNPQEAVFTWLNLQLPQRPGPCTLQVVLRRDGSFDLSYASIPSPTPPRWTDAPHDGWLVAVLSGATRTPPAQVRFAAAPPQDTLTVGPGGLVQDHIFQTRQHLAQLSRPLCSLVLLSTLVALLLLPFILNPTLVRPLNDLVEAARRVNGGLLDDPAPLHHQDEIGFLAQTFNAMMRRLRTTPPQKPPPPPTDPPTQ